MHEKHARRDRQLHGTRRGDYISPPDLFDIAKGVKSLVEVGGVYPGPGLLTGEGDPLPVGKGTVTANWFSMLGVRPEIGRFFDPGEDDAGAAKVVVINDDLWRTRFGADRGVLGRVIMIDHIPRTVIGVALGLVAFSLQARRVDTDRGLVGDDGARAAREPLL